MQTALHIYSLVGELKSCIVGGKFRGTEFYKKEREAYLLFKAKKGLLALGLVYHPHGYGSFLIPHGKVKVETTEKPWPFFQPAYGGEVVSVEQYDLDRIFRIGTEKGDDRFTIVVEAIGPNGNFWLLDERNMIIATLRNKKYDPSRPYRPPSPPGKLNPFDLSLRHMIELLGGSDQMLVNVLRKNVMGLDDFLIGEIMHRAGIEPHAQAGEIRAESAEKLVLAVKEVAARFDDYSRGYFYRCASGNFVYPFKPRRLEEECQKCKSLSFALYTALRTRRAMKTEFDEKESTLEAVRKHVKRLSRKAAKVEKDLEAAHGFEQNKRFAELLKIYMKSIQKGMEYIEVDDIFSEDRRKIVIELDPALTPVQNAEVYFRKYRKGREGRDLLDRRLEVAQKELMSAQAMLEEFERDYDSAVQKYEAEIAGILPKAAERRAPVVRLPYREFTLSTGVTVFVGKDGDDNDRTTFGYARPYELWFHTSQTPGSHVVMKFPDKGFVPSKAEIIETAAIAAFFSKARNSKAVPVVYTQKKYVRKPRKAKPGLVTVEREKMVMVEPKKPE
jgi:predicted ribosome quality control (RQC) complex YloA/Tae2 family protein